MTLVAYAETDSVNSPLVQRSVCVRLVYHLQVDLLQMNLDLLQIKLDLL